MKKPRKRKKGPVVTEQKSADAPVSPAQPAVAIFYGPHIGGAIPPEVAFREAEEESDRNFLSAYVGSIQKLREKGFSYREIAEWLKERGVDVDYNAVYRVFIKHIRGMATREEQLAEEEAYDREGGDEGTAAK